ncbi:MAG: hypothetical protein GXP23_10570 [Gammaproteobacteria bacterium]|nr:hypothetical protein [Gammaproteobacteria bacterium]
MGRCVILSGFGPVSEFVHFMNIAAIIAVRDEVELIGANIDYHLSIGFEGIVVADIFSSDGTGEKLESYKDNPRVSVIKAPSQDWKVFDWREVLVEIAKEIYQPDFISHIDPDDFLYSPAHDCLDFGAFDHDQLTIKRFNCVSGLTQDFVLPTCMRGMDQFDVVKHPAASAFLQKGSAEPAVWLFTHIAPKLICRSDAVARFIGGSHSAVDQYDQELQGTTSDSLAFIHFPLTTYKRFLRKVNNLNDHLINLLEERTEEAYAYHWKRWCRLYRDGGDEAVFEEYQRQLAAMTNPRYEICTDIAQNCLK